MKINIYCLLPFLLLSCSKDIELDKGLENFSVKTESLTYKAGEEVNFEFEGNANLITFYSGELFSEYAFKDGRVIETPTLDLSFQSAVPVLNGGQTGQFSVLVSSDFNGDMSDFSHVRNATWTDVTSRFRYPTTVTFVASTIQSIADLRVEGKPLYIAFRYVTKPQAVYGPGRSWHAKFFLLTSNTSIGPVTIADQSSIGFQLVGSDPENSPSISAVTATQVNLYPNNFTPAHDPETETWAISKPLQAGTLHYPGDSPVAVKGIATSQVKRYTHVYPEAGTYKAYFVATNVNVYDKQQVVRHIELSITD